MTQYQGLVAPAAMVGAGPPPKESDASAYKTEGLCALSLNKLVYLWPTLQETSIYHQYRLIT